MLFDVVNSAIVSAILSIQRLHNVKDSMSSIEPVFGNK